MNILENSLEETRAFVKTQEFSGSPKKKEAIYNRITKNTLVSPKFNSKTFTKFESLVYNEVPVCLASKAMTKLLDWRNNDKVTSIQGIAIVLFGLKVLVIEIAQPFVGVCALVETVAYGALTLKDYVLGREHTWSQLLGSSAFTTVWAVTVLCYYNPLCKIPKVYECLAKEELTKIFDDFLREETDIKGCEKM